MKIFKYAFVAAALIAAPAIASDTSVLQKNQQFSQAELTVHAGEMVRWGNADSFNHNITIKGADGDVDLGLQKPTQILSHKFEVAGTYVVICHIHPRMKMTVNVQ